VQEGEYPEVIAAQYGITVDALMAANGIVDPSGLYIGQELIIPPAE
jgi:LysM repeat protein